MERAIAFPDADISDFSLTQVSRRHVDKVPKPSLSYRMPQLDRETASETFPIPDVIPIFPLPNVVFFPNTYLPLHIFEPRYRDMITQASQEGQCIGMVLLKEGWENDYYGVPPVFSLGCVGRIKNIQSLADGRSNVILHGLSRYDIEEEFFDTSYRRAKIALRADEPFQDPVDPGLRLGLTKLALQYLRARKAQELCKLITGQSISDTVLINSLSSCLDFTPFEKQFLLESESLHQQTRRLIDLLRFKLDAQKHSTELE